jgi:small subunit ribosomal protein S20
LSETHGIDAVNASKKGKKMANIKSSKKRILTAERNAVKNQAFRSSIKTAVKKALELAQGKDKEALNAAVAKVYQLCDKAVVKGILHKNTAARKKSRLTIALNKLSTKK